MPSRPAVSIAANPALSVTPACARRRVVMPSRASSGGWGGVAAWGLTLRVVDGCEGHPWDAAAGLLVDASQRKVAATAPHCTANPHGTAAPDSDHTGPRDGQQHAADSEHPASGHGRVGNAEPSARREGLRREGLRVRRERGREVAGWEGWESAPLPSSRQGERQRPVHPAPFLPYTSPLSPPPSQPPQPTPHTSPTTRHPPPDPLGLRSVWKE